MEAVLKQEEDKTTLSLVGEVTIYEAENIRKSVMDAVFLEGDKIEINLSRVEEIDTCGMQVLMLAKRESARLDKELVLTGHSSPVLELMNVFNLAEYFGDPLVLSTKD